MRILLAMLLFSFVFVGCRPDTERIDSFAVHGIDVSHHQKSIDWSQIEQQELDFVFIKATEGATHVDSNFVKHWDRLKGSRLRRGAYHFFRPNVEISDQIANFLSLVDYQPGDLPPVLDVEVIDQVSAPVLIAGIKQWLNAVESKLKIKPILYTNQKFYNKHLYQSLDSYPLWIARYNNTTPPTLQNNQKWTFWQYGNRGKLAGVETAIDFNVFVGSVEELDALCFKK